MKAVNLKRYLQYIVNTEGNVTIEDFDEDWEPIGPDLRDKLMPHYVRVREDGKLELTEAGQEELTK